MDKKDIKSAFQNQTIIADGTMADEVNYIFNKMKEQEEIVSTRVIVEDIIKAYKGDLEWNTYLKERHEYNAKVKEENNSKILRFNETPSEYKLEYKLELPILDFKTFSIAEFLGKIDRNEGNKQC